tara:strand:+ start:31 stop:498 length:468 start_codon:yes stop_codon:yes gene_type:complete
MRTRVALLVTLLFLSIIILYCYSYWGLVSELKPNELGDLIAGTGSILAFFWLIFGYFQQGQELKENTLALQNQELQLREQAQQTKDLAKFARAQAEAMKALADSTKQSVAHNKSLSDHTRKSNELSQKLIVATEKQAKATTDLGKAISIAATRIR